MPNRNPVNGSASIETSCATRMGWGSVAPLGSVTGTEPRVYHGCEKYLLVPPPPPNCHPAGSHCPLLRISASSPQTVAPLYWLCAPMKTDVPPTEVTYGSESGKSACGVVR